MLLITFITMTVISAALCIYGTIRKKNRADNWVRCLNIHAHIILRYNSLYVMTFLSHPNMV